LSQSHHRRKKKKEKKDFEKDIERHRSEPM